MKTVLVFIGLKIAEIAVACAVAVGLSAIGAGVLYVLGQGIDLEYSFGACVGYGFVGFGVVIIVGWSLVATHQIIFCLIPWWLSANWRKAKELTGKGGDK